MTRLEWQDFTRRAQIFVWTAMLRNPVTRRAQIFVWTAMLRNPVYRLLVRRQQRRVLSRRGIESDRVIIFLVPGYDRVDGGIMSIVSLADETEKLVHIH